MMTVLAFTSMAQALPRPMNSSIEEWVDGANYDERDGTYTTSAMIHLKYGTDIMGNPVADDYPGFYGDELITGELTYTLLDPDKLFYRIYTDNDIPFVFTSDVYPALFADVYPGMQEATLIPFGYNGGDIEYWGPHFPGLTNHVEELAEFGIVIEPFFTWRIGVQMVYIDNGQTSTSDIVYMEVFPQLKPATQVTSTSFLADWSCDYENTYIINNFYDNGLPGYYLYVINKATQDTIAINNIEAPNYVEDDFGNPEYLAGATYLVEGLEPGATYEYYVVVRQNSSAGGVYQSVVREVTLPMPAAAPVMLPADYGFVTHTSFRADWTHEVNPDMVQDYTLYVTAAANTPLLTETFGKVTAESDQNTNIASYLDDYCDNEGWTGAYVYETAGGLKFGNSSNGGVLTTPALDFTQSGGIVTVSFNGMYYNTDKTTVTVSCGDVSETVELTNEAADYTVVLNGVPEAAGQNVTISSSGSRKRYYLYNVTVSTGNASASSEPIVITGVTGNTCHVENLTPNTTYNYYVVANYTDGTSAASNVKQVTLLPPPAPELIADPATVTMTASYGEVVTATFDVLGANLMDNVILYLDDDTEMFSINPSTIGLADAENGATVTVTYTPTEVGNHTASITITSEGAEDVTVTLNGTTTMEASAPFMFPAAEEYITTTSFRADWSDETPAQNVVDYTLYVNIKPETPQPADLLLNETFYSEDVPSADSNIDVGESLDDFCDNPGWTGYAVYPAGGGGMKLSSGSKTGYITTPALDMTNCGGIVTVNFNAKSYGSDNSSIIVKCGEVADTIQLTAEAADYSVVLEGVTAAEGQNVTLSGVRNGKRLYIYGVQIYNGLQSREIVETGGADSRVITGITDKYYVVENLTPGATYTYYVEANYINNTKAASNVEEVTLLADGHGFELGDVNHDRQINVTDVTTLIAMILQSDYTLGCPICGELTGEGEINVTDVTALIAKILNQ